MLYRLSCRLFPPSERPIGCRPEKIACRSPRTSSPGGSGGISCPSWEVVRSSFWFPGHAEGTRLCLKGTLPGGETRRQITATDRLPGLLLQSPGGKPYATKISPRSVKPTFRLGPLDACAATGESLSCCSCCRTKEFRKGGQKFAGVTFPPKETTLGLLIQPSVPVLPYLAIGDKHR